MRPYGGTERTALPPRTGCVDPSQAAGLAPATGASPLRDSAGFRPDFAEPGPPRHETGALAPYPTARWASIAEPLVGPLRPFPLRSEARGALTRIGVRTAPLPWACGARVRQQSRRGRRWGRAPVPAIPPSPSRRSRTRSSTATPRCLPGGARPGLPSRTGPSASSSSVPSPRTSAPGCRTSSSVRTRTTSRTRRPSSASSSSPNSGRPSCCPWSVACWPTRWTASAS